jgi:hypothetical protein
MGGYAERMPPHSTHTEEFKRGMATHYLIEHKRKREFKVSNRVDGLTLEELRKRGCGTTYDRSTGVWTVSSGVPFGTLVTRSEWREHRLLFPKGCAAVFLIRVLPIAGVVVAAALKMGILTGAIWALGIVVLGSCVFPDSNPKGRGRLLAIGAALFGLGWLVYALGWSGDLHR